MRRSLILAALTGLSACAADGGGGRRGASAPGLDLAEIGPGAALPFGEVAELCGQPARSLGQTVAREAGFALHDTAPGSTGARTHYVTGFGDGCARQFTAALALFGEVATLEATAYGAGIAHSPVQPAYEAIKAEVCGVAPGQPCSDGLARNTTVLTAYAAFGASGRHADMLLHDGRLLASGVED